MSYSVVIVDDEKMVINSLALSFPWEDTNFEVIATFQNSKIAYEQIQELKPDVVYSDIKMPGMSGLELMENLKDKVPSTKFVFISGYSDFEYAKKAIELGASGYCVKPLEDEEILEVLKKIEVTLEENKTNLEMLFYRMMQIKTKESEESFFHFLSTLYNLPDTFYILTSINDMDELLENYGVCRKIRYEKNTYFYIMEEGEFLKSPRFKQQIKQAMYKGKIKNFAYNVYTEKYSLVSQIEKLLDHIYSFFLWKDDQDSNFKVVKKHEYEESKFFKELEQYYCKNKITSIRDYLREYEKLYAVEERSMSELIKIYNLLMAAIYRKENQFFDEAIVCPYELTESFENLHEMMAYFIDTISSQVSNYTPWDMELIKNNTFKQILNYINLNYNKSISFQNICKEYSINPSYLSQVFQREIGTTFTNYLTDLRVNHAKDLLENTSNTIGEISEQVGYDQYFYFSKLFKKYTGMSPSQYRESKRAN